VRLLLFMLAYNSREALRRIDNYAQETYNRHAHGKWLGMALSGVEMGNPSLMQAKSREH
jgi:hypothetical protein